MVSIWYHHLTCILHILGLEWIFAWTQLLIDPCPMMLWVWCGQNCGLFLKYSSIVLFGICLMYEIIPKLCPCKNHISYYLKYYIYMYKNYWNIWIEIYNSNIINKDQPFNCTYVWPCLITTTTTKISYLRWSSPYATMHVHKRGINCT